MDNWIETIREAERVLWGAEGNGSSAIAAKLRAIADSMEKAEPVAWGCAYQGQEPFAVWHIDDANEHERKGAAVWPMFDVFNRDNRQVITEENCDSFLTNKLMDCADFLGQFPKAKIDGRAWKHLLVYSRSEEDAPDAAAKIVELEAYIASQEKYVAQLVTDFGNDFSKNSELEAQNKELIAQLTSIAEYWNRDQNEAAMADACWYAISTADAAIAKVKL